MDVNVNSILEQLRLRHRWKLLILSCNRSITKFFFLSILTPLMSLYIPFDVIKVHILPHISDPPTMLRLLIIFHKLLKPTDKDLIKPRFLTFYRRLGFIDLYGNMFKCVFSYSAYPNGCKHGKYVLYIDYDNYYAVRERCEYVNGKRDGLRTEHFNTGELCSTVTYVNDVYEGDYIFYRPNGSISFIERFINGVSVDVTHY